MAWGGMELDVQALNIAFTAFSDKWDDPKCGGKLCVAHAINAYLEEITKQTQTRESGNAE